MAKWTTSETGILRKKQQKDNFDDLLVFGYACKLFRDDEKASYIDKGMHLIPWMGDEKLRIDRYDCRGALSELNSCEASREGYDAMRWLGLSESERKIEQLCDEERYYSLHKNEEEEAMYREEELKRLQQKTNEFHFNYDEQNDTNKAPAESPAEEKPPTVEEDDRPYVPPPELDVPADIMIPKTVKENARIVKTAQFISQQGSQMEILIKTKQAENPQFDFMNSTDPLFKYYRHVLQAIKNGRYNPDACNKSDQGLDESVEQDSDEHYLHPSLLATTAQSVSAQPSVSIPSVPYRPSADCLYSQLVNRIQGSQQVENVPKPEAPPPPPPNVYDQQQQQYYQYYYMMQCYEYYKQMLQYQSQNYPHGEGGPEMQQIQDQLNYITQYLQQQHQQQQNPNNPYAQIVANLSQHTKDNPYPLPPVSSASGTASNLPQIPEPPPPKIPPCLPPQDNEITKAPVLYNSNVKEEIATPPVLIGPQLPENLVNVNVNNSSAAATAACAVTTATATVPTSQAQKDSNNKPKQIKSSSSSPTTVKIQTDSEDLSKKAKPLLSLVHYGSDSESASSCSDNDDDEEDTRKYKFKTPPEDMQVIIDKMASYVSKNGNDFETIVKNKGDPRFDFLNSNHEFHAYYKHKIAIFSGTTTTTTSAKESSKKSSDKEKDKSSSNNNNNTAAKKEKKIITPVCFSIKKPKEETPKDIKSALPIEESDDEDERSSDSAKNNLSVVSLSSTTNSSNSNNNNLIIANSAANCVASSTAAESTNNQFSAEATAAIHNTENVNLTSLSLNETVASCNLTNSANGTCGSEIDDPILEMIDLTFDLEERRDAKRAEDKIKDKLAAAAREKLASASRDKALQIERKKKAAAFLKLKSGVEADSKEIDSDCVPIKEYSIKSPKRKSPFDSPERRHKKNRKKSSERHSKYRKRSRSRSHSRSRSKSYNHHQHHTTSSRNSTQRSVNFHENEKREKSKSKSKSREVYSRSRSRSHLNSPRISTSHKNRLKPVQEEAKERRDKRRRSRSRSKSKSKNRERRRSSESNDVRFVSIYKLPNEERKESRNVDVNINKKETERLTTTTTGEREIIIKEDNESGVEEGEIKKHKEHKKSSKKKKSHKSKRSRSRHDSHSHHSHKKSKKKRRSKSSSVSYSSS